MKAPRFDYARPSTVEVALELLAEHGDAAAVLAGGQSLMPLLNLRMAAPGLLVDINRMAGLDGIGAEGDGLVIGAMARHTDVMAHPLVAARAPLLVQALGHVAHAAIRNRGTLGGSLALADPASELPACMVCLGARIVTRSLAGKRVHEAGDFFHGLYATARRADELVVRVEVPGMPGWRQVFLEVARRHGDYAIVGLALAVRGAEMRAAFCGVEPAPRLLRSAEALDGLEPMASDDAPPEYRRHLARVLLRRGLAHG